MSTYPTVRPSLTLDFQKSKQLDPRISFSRSSSATYVEGGVVKYADEHQARFEKEGLLMEESRTNYNFYSNDFSNAHYLNINNRLTETNTTAPDGSNDAISFGEVVGQTPMGINPSVPTQTFTSSTASVYVKVFGSRQYISIREVKASNNWVRAVFDCTGAGSFQTVEGDVVTRTGFTANIKNVGNGWYRCSLNVTYSTAQQVGFYFNPSDSDTGGSNTSINFGSPSSTPIAGSGFVLWGYQQEAGSFPTSLIPTSGSTVTRSKDIAQITGDNFSSWFNGNQGTMVSDVIVPFRECSYYAFAGANRITALSYTTPGTLTQSIGSQLSFAGTSYDDPVKLAVAYDDLEFVAVRDGGTVQSDPSTVNKTGIDKLYLGRYYSGTNFAKGVTISRLAYYPERLTDEQLEAITS